MADSLDQRLSPEQLRTVTLARDKGASGWLNVLPLEDIGYVLNKEEFRDALGLRYISPFQIFQINVRVKRALTLLMRWSVKSVASFMPVMTT